VRGTEHKSNLLIAKDVVSDYSETDAGDCGRQPLDNPPKYEHDDSQDKENVGYCFVAQF
jgi:hypothetical protein